MLQHNYNCMKFKFENSKHLEDSRKYQFTTCRVTEDRSLHQHRCDSLYYLTINISFSDNPTTRKVHLIVIVFPITKSIYRL